MANGLKRGLDIAFNGEEAAGAATKQGAADAAIPDENTGVENQTGANIIQLQVHIYEYLQLNANYFVRCTTFEGFSYVGLKAYKTVGHLWDAWNANVWEPFQSKPVFEWPKESSAFDYLASMQVTLDKIGKPAKVNIFII